MSLDGREEEHAFQGSGSPGARPTPWPSHSAGPMLRHSPAPSPRSCEVDSGSVQHAELRRDSDGGILTCVGPVTLCPQPVPPPSPNCLRSQGPGVTSAPGVTPMSGLSVCLKVTTWQGRGAKGEEGGCSRRRKAEPGRVFSAAPVLLDTSPPPSALSTLIGGPRLARRQSRLSSEVTAYPWCIQQVLSKALLTLSLVLGW